MQKACCKAELNEAGDLAKEVESVDVDETCFNAKLNEGEALVEEGVHVDVDVDGTHATMI